MSHNNICVHKNTNLPNLIICHFRCPSHIFVSSCWLFAAAVDCTFWRQRLSHSLKQFIFKKNLEDTFKTSRQAATVFDHYSASLTFLSQQQRRNWAKHAERGLPQQGDWPIWVHCQTGENVRQLSFKKIAALLKTKICFSFFCDELY